VLRDRTKEEKSTVVDSNKGEKREASGGKLNKKNRPLTRQGGVWGRGNTLNFKGHGVFRRGNKGTGPENGEKDLP